MGVCGGLGFEVRVRLIGKAVFLVRCVLYPGSRVSGQYSHLGCWLAVEMVIDGRLRQGKALFKVVGNEFGSKRGRRQGKRKERGTSPHPLHSCCALRRTSLSGCLL